MRGYNANELSNKLHNLNLNLMKNTIGLLITMVLVCAYALTSYGQTTIKEKNSKTEGTATKSQVKMSVEGMTCMNCVNKVKNSIENLKGVEKVKVSLEDKLAIVTYVTSKIEPEKIQEAVNKTGFKAGKPVESEQ
jgi:copper chaperone CopZ